VLVRFHHDHLFRCCFGFDWSGLPLRGELVILLNLMKIFSRKNSRFLHTCWMALVVLLGCVALPSFGVATSVRSAVSGENQSTAEEIQEILGERQAASHRPRSKPQRVETASVWRADEKAVIRLLFCRFPVQGHRFSNGLLAPIRC
jgi:hypothetical protein